MFLEFQHKSGHYVHDIEFTFIGMYAAKKFGSADFFCKIIKETIVGPVNLVYETCNDINICSCLNDIIY